MKRAVAIFLNICLGLFVASGAVSLIDDSLRLLWGLPLLTVFSGILSFFTVLAILVVYPLMGVTPLVPKRVFLPVALFFVAASLAMIPVAIYDSGDWMRRAVQVDWVTSLCQTIVGLIILYLLQGGWKIRWPLVEDKHLGSRGFSWLNLSLFALTNVFVLLPVIAAYLFLCVALAVSHFTAGFLTVRPSGLTAHVREYTRSDGKKVELVPMAHVADADFYGKLSQSFPTNSIVLMEGVTDKRNLMTNGISYKRMARSLGVVEQQKYFKPRGEVVMADVDVDQFSTNTISVLNFAMYIHGRGINADTLMKLAEFSAPPDILDQLDDDLVTKRNEHLLKELHARLSESDDIIVPWGAGHMPGIASAIEKDGFRLEETQDYTVIRFRF